MGVGGCSVGLLQRYTIITLDTLHYRGKIIVKTYPQLTNSDGLDFVNLTCLENSFFKRFLNQQVNLINEGEIPVAEISKIKFFCAECLESIASEAMQIFGGAGYLRGNAVERIYREVKVMAIGGGSKEIMKDLTVKQLGL